MCRGTSFGLWLALVGALGIATTAQGGSFSYGTGSDGFIYEVDYAAGTVNPLWDTGITWYGATDGITASTIFGTPQGDGLYEIDVVLQTVNLVGLWDPVLIRELAYHEGNGTLYATDYSDLYTVNVNDASLTLVGGFNGPDTTWAMDYDAGIDELVAVNQNDNAMYYIDLVTGNAQFVGLTGHDRITDIWYDSTTDTMKGVGNVPGRLFELDTLTGQATETANIDPVSILGLGNVAGPPGAPVCLDIKPGSCPNPVNAKSGGYIPMALTGSVEFDVQDIDIGSLVLFRADGVGGSVMPWEGPPGPHTTIDDVATPICGGDGELCECTTDGPDGVDDLVMHFKTQDVVAALELYSVPGGSELELCVSGTLLDGTPFEACDCILIVPPHGNAVVSANAGVSLGLSPMDLFGNSGGVGVLTRWYLPNTELTVTAPAIGRHVFETFHHWLVDGAAQPTGQTTITVTVSNWNQPKVLRAVYGAPSTHVVGQGPDAE